MTLLVLELKVPSLQDHHSVKELGAQLLDMLPVRVIRAPRPFARHATLARRRYPPCRVGGSPMTVPSRRGSAAPYCFPVCRSIITAWADEDAPVAMLALHGGMSCPMACSACTTAAENGGVGVKPSGKNGPVSQETEPRCVDDILGALIACCIVMP